MRALVRRIACALRRVLGAPDYAGYVAHHHAQHPGTVPLSEPEFVRQQLRSRYERPGARCC